MSCGRGGVRRAGEALAVEAAAVLALQPHPFGRDHVRRLDQRDALRAVAADDVLNLREFTLAPALRHDGFLSSCRWRCAPSDSIARGIQRPRAIHRRSASHDGQGASSTEVIARAPLPLTDNRQCSVATLFAARRRRAKEGSPRREPWVCGRENGRAPAGGDRTLEGGWPPPAGARTDFVLYSQGLRAHGALRPGHRLPPACGGLYGNIATERPTTDNFPTADDGDEDHDEDDALRRRPVTPGCT